MRCPLQDVGQTEGTGVRQPGGGDVQFVDRAGREDLGEGLRSALPQRVAADEEPFDPAPVAGGRQQRVGEDQDARRVEAGLDEVEGAQRPGGLDEFGRGPAAGTAERVAFEPDPGDPGGGAQLVGDAAGAARGDVVAAQVERLHAGAGAGRGGGPLVTERVGAEEQVPYRGGPLGEGLGDQGGTLGAQPLLAQVQPAVGQCRTGREVQAFTGGAARSQPVQQGTEFGLRARHDAGDAREAGTGSFVHHCASR